LLSVIERLRKRLTFAEIIPLCALTGHQVDILERHLMTYLPEGPFLFDEAQKTDKNLHFQLAEIIREKLIRYVVKELPYTTTVAIERIETLEKIDHIYAIIWVEREGQKSIVIGHQGEKIKSIGLSARKDMELLLDKHVNLKLWVKVKEDWSDSEKALIELGIQ
jgi:GTP-binding protein Era